MSKRKKFIITSVLLSLGFIGISYIENQYRFVSIGTLSLLTIILFIWSLWEGLGKNMTLTTLLLPLLFTLGVGLFWFLLPASIYARIPVLLFYGFGVYTLCLTANIYTVGAIRTIALLRAARGVGFVFSLITSFLLFDAILSLRTNLLTTAAAAALVSFLIFFQGLWTIPLTKSTSKTFMMTTSIFSLIIAQIAISLYFWPVTVVVGSLFLTVAVYMLLGLGQAELEERLFPQTVREYLFVGLLVFIGMFIATTWGA